MKNKPKQSSAIPSAASPNNSIQVIYCHVSTRDQVTNDIIGEYLVHGMRETYQIDRLRSTVNKVLLSLPTTISSGYQQSAAIATAPNGDWTRTTTMRHSFASDRFHVHVLVDAKFAYSCISFSHAKTQACFHCLEQIQTQVVQMVVARENMSSKLQRVIVSCVQFVNDPANTKMLNIQNQLGELKGVMLGNVDKILDNLEDVDRLANRSERLYDDGTTFVKRSHEIKTRHTCRWIILTLVLLTSLVIIGGVTGIVVYKVVLAK